MRWKTKHEHNVVFGLDCMSHRSNSTPCSWHPSEGPRVIRDSLDTFDSFFFFMFVILSCSNRCAFFSSPIFNRHYSLIIIIIIISCPLMCICFFERRECVFIFFLLGNVLHIYTYIFISLTKTQNNLQLKKAKKQNTKIQINKSNFRSTCRRV